MCPLEFESKARSLINYHVLGWKFSFDRAKRRLGCCHYNTKTLSFSIHFVRQKTWEELKNTVLHEIAHALTPGHNHNIYWKRVAISIGAKPDRCSSIFLKIDKPWVLDCLCDNPPGFLRKPKYIESKYNCKKCKTAAFFRKNNELSISE